MSLPGRLRRMMRPFQPGFDPYPVDATPRYGRGKPRHAALESLIASGRTRYGQTLERMAGYAAAELSGIQNVARAGRASEPFWENGFLAALDAAALSYFLASSSPSVYLEIGSGESTKFARATIARHRLKTKIVSIDPQPRAEVESLCDTSLRQGLETVPAGTFSDLQPGDVVFFDGSHRVGMNSDVTVFFLEVLPALPPGVLIQIHDIYWPDDYPLEWVERRYSEQYMLGACLIMAPERFEVKLPNAFICQDEPLRSGLEVLWTAVGAPPRMRNGESFWFTKLS